ARRWTGPRATVRRGARGAHTLAERRIRHVRTLQLKPARRAQRVVRLPGSKSISNRVLLLAALAEGETKLHGLLDADDTSVMLDALQKLGVKCDARAVIGVGGPFPGKRGELFLGNAGTAF